MLYVNDTYFDKSYFSDCYQQFDQEPVLADCKGKRIAVCMKSVEKWIALCLYIQSKGGSVLPQPVDTPLSAAKNRAIKSGSHYLLFDPSDSANTIASENIHAINEAAAAVESGLVQMSSGTTGEPKYIARSWQSISSEIKSYIQHFAEPNTMTPVVACPVTHSYGLICGVLVALQRSVTPHVISNTNPKYILKKMAQLDSPILYSSPTLICTLSMLSKPDAPLHAVMTSGTLMQQSGFDKVVKSCSHLYQQYGCSEVGCISIAKNVTSANQIGTPLPHLRITCGQTGNTPGEIVVEKLDGQTVHTNDLGYFDDKGQLHFVSRLDDMINVAGQNVYPAEVEDVVLAMSEMDDAVVFKAAHTFGSDMVCLAYVATQDIAENEIRKWCRERLASYQVPMKITRVEAIPRMPNGKISRKKIVEDGVLQQVTTAIA